MLDRPTNPVLVQGRSITSSVLAFFLCVLGAFALIHLLEGMALRLDGLSVRPAGEGEGEGEDEGEGEEEDEDEGVPAPAVPGPNGVHARGTANGHGSREHVASPTPQQPGLSSASSSRRAKG